ncbi:hypothetical protein TBLA_0A04170 [Henningerozyma blattae CBS 6284]|uniref:Uncharacterized protein n=1 Tax=Henningerozyma blattae (strain ATCC 34711 / CBS 6284 / DSM 70876 / NBRC 10599 / NRRL Y-10934 / UCD 77-7) TaxID=1071380 RepID=I2GVR1_HENB6|nr:hypothetical protein TBLA_0A04170 [Tetrapisispora blattae CBS 6284]CCH58213.1 hypothetical protein TBLA_0A04170 [Tetrapisispora blattae CBS 6284]
MEISIEKVQLDFINNDIAGNIKTFQVQSNIMCFGLRSGLLFIIDLDNPAEACQYQLQLTTSGANSESLSKAWLSPNGKILFIKTDFARYYFCDIYNLLNSINTSKGKLSNITQAKKLSRKRCDIRSVQWCNNNSLLCGTENGKLYYIYIHDYKNMENFLLGESKLVKLYQSKHSIDGISWIANENVCLVASGQKIMLWKGNNNSNNKKSDTIAKDPETLFKENPNPFNEEEFEKVHKEGGTKFASLQNSFAWVTGTGIVYEEIVKSSEKNNILSDANVFLNIELPQSNFNIRDIILTQFHIMLLRGSTITVINQLNNEIAFDETIPITEQEKILGITSDYSDIHHPTFWCFSNNNIYEIIIKKEANSVWKMLCVNGQYEKALSLEGLSSIERSNIFQEMGEYYFKDSKFNEAAQSFGNSFSSPIRSIALKFFKTSSTNTNNALLEYLSIKLDSLDSSNQVQKILLSSWIVWIYMKLFNDLQEDISVEHNIDKLAKLNDSKENIRMNLKKFLKTHLESFDKYTILQILSKQQGHEFSIYFENLLGHYDHVLSYWIDQKNWNEALKLLVETQDPNSCIKFASILLLNCPEETIIAWMKIPQLQPTKLIPALLNYFTHYQKKISTNPETNSIMEPNYALNYLKWYIDEYGTPEKILYNTTIYMVVSGYPSHVVDEIAEENIIKFMKLHEGQYDIEFILRLTMKYKRIRIVLYIYSLLNLYEDAVNFALENGMIDSAKQLISQDNNDEIMLDEKIIKELWIKIAKVILYENKTQDIKSIIKTIIHESNEILTIRDLLPLFNQFTTIANLKEELIKSLETHGQSMTQVSEDIKQSIKMKKIIVQDIEMFKQRYVMLEPRVSCSHCNMILQTRKFFVFPCNHSFHTDCLIKVILNSNDYILKSKIENFQANYNNKKKQKQSIKEFETMLSSKCVLCSEININNIDSPLQIEEEELAKWEI